MTNPTTITANPGGQVVDIERVIDAPVADVYRAYTEADLIAKWLGPRGYDTNVTKFDIRDGGQWAFVHTNPEGESYAFHGSYHSVQPRERIVQTFEYEGDAGHPSMEVFTFVDLGAERCRVEGLSVFLSVGDRDAVLHDLDAGRDEDFERLDEYLADTGDR